MDTRYILSFDVNEQLKMVTQNSCKVNREPAHICSGILWIWLDQTFRGVGLTYRWWGWYVLWWDCDWLWSDFDAWCRDAFASLYWRQYSSFLVIYRFALFYVWLIEGSTILLGLTSPDIDLVGLRIITLATLVIILISLMKSSTYL